MFFRGALTVAQEHKWGPVNWQGNLTKLWEGGLVSHPGGVPILLIPTAVGIGRRRKGRVGHSFRIQDLIAHGDVLCYKPVSGEADWLIDLKKSRALLVPGRKHLLPLQLPEKNVIFLIKTQKHNHGNGLHYAYV